MAAKVGNKSENQYQDSKYLGKSRILAEKWIEEQKIKTPVLLDGAKNEFWNQTGQSSNMSVLFSADGQVLFKQPWFESKELETAIKEEGGCKQKVQPLRVGLFFYESIALN